MNENVPPPESLEPPAQLTEQELLFLRRYYRERPLPYRVRPDGTLTTANNTEGI